MIHFQEKKYPHLKLIFSKKNTTIDIIAALIQLRIPLSETDRNNWEFVVSELVFNSIRASRERKKDEKIQLKVRIDENYFTTVIMDGAGGFDIRKLPYDIYEPAEKIDVFSEDFEHYRKKNHFMRYGLGLFSAKKYSDYFDIYMLDKHGRRMRFFDELKTYGTFIIFKKKLRS
ncbi:MAG TPA: hypothetical protein DHW82_04020 [Spirochaetia bacterium]|nr:MAG: hypothetical protein A2Y41_01750 [Spirochaetes bacterium GWB1_36_13]HCL56159.1 hypothetical protein [Spirochaetia bacterium]